MSEDEILNSATDLCPFLSEETREVLAPKWLTTMNRQDLRQLKSFIEQEWLAAQASALRDIKQKMVDLGLTPSPGVLE